MMPSRVVVCFERGVSGGTRGKKASKAMDDGRSLRMYRFGRVRYGTVRDELPRCISFRAEWSGTQPAGRCDGW